MIWIVSILPMIFSSFSTFCLFFRPLDTVPSTPTTIGITVTFMFYCFFLKLWQDTSLCPFAFFHYYTVDHWIGKVHKWASSLFLVNLYKVFWSRLEDPFVSQSTCEFISFFYQFILFAYYTINRFISHLITYTCYFFAFQFSLWYYWFLYHFFLYCYEKRFSFYIEFDVAYICILLSGEKILPLFNTQSN